MMKRFLRRSIGPLVGAVVVAVASSAFAAPAEDIRGVRPPLVIPPWWRVPLIAAVVTAAVVLVALGARALWRRWHRPETPLQRALRALSTAEALARSGDAHAWADTVAETVRSSLAVRLGADVLPRTTSELAKAPWAAWVRETSEVPLAGDPVRLPEAAALLAVLDVCDLARFARASIAPDALVAFTARARELVTAFHAPPPAARLPSSSRAPLTATAV
jgi:hypothetical protein